MDLGFAGSTAVVTGGSKGMGLAIAEALAGKGASVAVMARRQEALDAAVLSLRAAGAPDAVGISVDMADAESIADGFAAVSQRWARLNSLVIPSSARSDRVTAISSRWTTETGTKPSASARCRPCDRSALAAFAAFGRLGPHREAVRALHSAAEPVHRGIHGVEGGAGQHHREPVQKPCQGWHPG